LPPKPLPFNALKPTSTQRIVAPFGGLVRGMTRDTTAPAFPVWRQPDGKPLSCFEKIKVLNENLAEIRQLAQDALEDGLLMGCSEDQLRVVLRQLVDSLENPYGKAK
jgi:hypothetical protein